jgi:hypothetical protein
LPGRGEARLPVLRHRLTLQPDAYIEGFTSDDILTTVLERVEVPR